MPNQPNNALQQILDCLPLMVAHIDEDIIYRAVNRPFRSFMGKREEEILGKHVQQVIGQNMYQAVGKYIDAALAGKPVSWECHHEAPANRREHILLSRLLPYIGSDGKQNGFLMVLEDITAFKRMQLELQTVNQRLEQQVAQRTQQLRDELNRRKALEKNLVRLAHQDSLTGLMNRRAFLKRLDEEIGRAQRYHSELCYMVIDIDHFKRINDTHGHPAGDAVLKSFAATLREVIRSSDFVGRIGGEEFAVALPNTSLTLGNELAERIRKHIAGQRVQYGGEHIAYTISIGVSPYLPEHHGSSEVMHSLADSALYDAKNNGRNRVCLAQWRIQ